MKNYQLTIPSVAATPTDAHGQPIRFFKANFENNVSKAIDQLSGICVGILADGVVNEKEAAFFADWVKRINPLEPVWPFTDILSRVNRIFADGRCDEEEREELKSIMQAICGQTEEIMPAETYSSRLPLDEKMPEPVVFSGRSFHITGRTSSGSVPLRLGRLLRSAPKLRSTNPDVSKPQVTHFWRNESGCRVTDTSGARRYATIKIASEVVRSNSPPKTATPSTEISHPSAAPSPQNT